MSHTIIVGIDGSSNSQGAVQWAIKHAQLSSAEIRLVAAYTVPGVNMSQADIVYPVDFDSAVKDATRQLAEATAETVRESGVHVSTVIAPGDASGVMVENSKSAELAVIGARGRGGFKGRLLGSVALAMPAHAHCPTVVIPSTWPDRPEPEHNAPIDLPVRATGARQTTDDEGRVHPDFSGEIVAGIDPFETDSPVLREAALQAKLYGQPLHLVGITATHILSPEWMPSETHLQKLYDEAAAQRELSVATLADEFPEVEVRWSIFDSPATEVLVAASHSAELLLVGSRGRGGFVATLLGSTSQSVLAHSVCPVRVVRVPRRKSAHR
ncbi:nucleotide-binding universal stress UspA family protein [Brevibacterium sanguinis]|uniref:Nucleotide-binding universal stress UspA family protein n=2 Tax=Brevibacterium TaxID=1696 RepID=A0A366ID48_9MICO|nr:MULTISPECIES: universal stress protein [Brevibacterium]RBP61495.1 nucleotide-binding universal stress UspA family protein [Brevibacterium sanguinis]RBP68589.1 nucleotide-binding universal stress UspA family protein [Brevibacterium celere]